MSLSINHVSVSSGGFELLDLSLEIATGECVVLSGRSGAGKTTIMEAICGLRQVLQGSIELDGENITHLRPAERSIGYVPQDTVLFPHMTVREHLAFASQLAGWNKNDISERVNKLAKGLGIKNLLLRKPKGLSGGESKRVAIGRAIAVRPKLLCLDEAFTGLDEKTRLEIVEWLKEVVEREGITALSISHHTDEMHSLAAKCYHLENGAIAEVSFR